METNTQDKIAITKALEDYYFKGVYEGNVSLLRQVFHEGTLVFGDVNGKPYFKTIDQYLDGVASRVSPKDSGKPYKASILSIDIINSIAVAKLNVQQYEFNYYNFMTLHKIEDRWLIVSKTLTNVAQ